MATPQTGIFALGTMSHAYLEFDLRPAAAAADLVAPVASLREPRTTIGGANLVAGFRPELWAAVAPEAAPSGVTGFDRPIVGRDRYTLAATQHDARAWESLSVEAQEAAIGRRKADSAELDPVPPTSHVARTDQEAFGRIFRRNIGYGTLVDHGTIFVGFAAQQGMLAAMLDSMVGRPGPSRDELTRYTTAISGASYVVPSLEPLGAFDGRG